jgi:hypothetical protein
LGVRAVVVAGLEAVYVAGRSVVKAVKDALLAWKTKPAA